MEFISNKLGIVYVATNLINKKQYVGQTSRNLKERKNNHRLEKTNFPIHLAIEKYGFKNFKWIPIEYPIEELDEMECFWIQKLNTTRPNGYNLQYGGQKHRNHSIETRIRMSKTRKKERHPLWGTHRSEETKRKISEANKGRSSYWLGKKRSEESKRKMKENHTDVSGKNHPQYGKGYLKMGKNNPMYGVHRFGTENPMYGKRHSEETKIKIREARQRYLANRRP